MKITKEWLSEKSACLSGTTWFRNQVETDSILVVKKLMSENQFSWANWLIFRLMTRKQYLAYVIYAAEQVINIYEKKYPGKSKPREAIEAAKAVLENDTKENRDAAAAAADAAYAAAYAAAAYAAYAAAAAAYAAYAAAYAAADAAAAAARKKMRIKILTYGLHLLEKGE